MSQSPLNAAVSARFDLNDHLCIVRIRPDSGRVPSFQPGQFMLVGLPNPDGDAPARPRPRIVRRPYSIASASHDTDEVEFFVVRIERGRLTPIIWPLGPGDRLWLDDRSRGDFTLAPIPPGRDLVFVCTGTGIAPFISMLRSHRGGGRWRRLALINGVREAGDLGYRRECEQYAAEDASFRYIPLVSRPRDDEKWTGRVGRVQSVLSPAAFEQVAGFQLNPDTCHVLLCGNPAMIQDVAAGLTDHGFTHHTRRNPGNLHYERYW